MKLQAGIRIGLDSCSPTLDHPSEQISLAGDPVAAKTRTRRGWGTQFVLLSVALMALAGCHSYHVETTVENHTGGPIRLLEVDYPSASFGVNNLEAGAEYHYRIQLRGSGPIKVQYTANDGRLIQIASPSSLSDRADYSLRIELLSRDAQFHLQPSSQP